MNRILLFATAAAIVATPAMGIAQTSPPRAPDGGDAVLQELVVTAQRRVENLQDVPIAATAISGDQLQAKAITTIDSLQFVAPALTISNSGLVSSVNMRGIGLASGSPQVAAGVAVY